jgi:hypothetical protein
MLNFLGRKGRNKDELLTSQLFDQNTFYDAFVRSLGSCKSELIIESPFITRRRTAELMPTLKKLSHRGVHIVINTRHPSEHDEPYRTQATEAITALEVLGCSILYTGGHHRKIAIIDRLVTWEGSLNILSYNDSCEIMRKITSRTLAEQMISFLEIDKYLRRD